MHRNTRIVLITGLFLCILLFAGAAAQAGDVVVSLNNYFPKFTADLSEYKGKRINLLDFNNQAKDTTLGYYFSPDKHYSYSGASFIDNYFWYSCERALISVGMVVSNRNRPDPSAPAVWLTLKSMTDAKFMVEVKLQKYIYGASLTKIYTIEGENVKPAERTGELMEKRAYNMTNKLFETILTDPEFKKVYFKAAAEMAQDQGK